MGQDARMVPKLFASGMVLPQSIMVSVLILTNGVFWNPHFISMMIQAARLQSKYIPVLAEDGFRFPSPSMIEELQSDLPGMLGTSNIDVSISTIIQLVQDVFKEIAIVFAPAGYSATESLLKVKAKNVADRCFSKNLKRNASSSTSQLFLEEFSDLAVQNKPSTAGVGPEKIVVLL